MQARLLKLDTELPRHCRPIGERVMARDVYASRIGFAQPCDTFDRSRFTGAVRAEQAENLAVVDSEVDPIDCHFAAIGFRQVS